MLRLVSVHTSTGLAIALNDQLVVAHNRNHHTGRTTIQEHRWRCRVGNLQNRPKLLTTFPPAREVMEHLQRIGWTQPIKVQYPEEASPIEFFLADMEAGENELIDLWNCFKPICQAGSSATSAPWFITNLPHRSQPITISLG
jgi:hypothetical protein